MSGSLAQSVIWTEQGPPIWIMPQSCIKGFSNFLLRIFLLLHHSGTLSSFLVLFKHPSSSWLAILSFSTEVDIDGLNNVEKPLPRHSNCDLLRWKFSVAENCPLWTTTGLPLTLNDLTRALIYLVLLVQNVKVSSKGDFFKSIFGVSQWQSNCWDKCPNKIVWPGYVTSFMFFVHNGGERKEHPSRLRRVSDTEGSGGERALRSCHALIPDCWDKSHHQVKYAQYRQMSSIPSAIISSSCFKRGSSKWW